MAQNVKEQRYRDRYGQTWSTFLLVTSEKVPVFRFRRAWTGERPSALALRSLWYANRRPRKDESGAVRRHNMETWLRDVVACDCLKHELRGLLLGEEVGRTREFLPSEQASRSWGRVLAECWQTGRSPWEVAPKHPVLEDWSLSFSTRAACEGNADRRLPEPRE